MDEFNLTKVINIFENLGNKKYNYIDFSEHHYKHYKFLREFPICNTKDVMKLIDYIISDSNNFIIFQYLTNFFDYNNILNILENLVIHKNNVLNIIEYENSKKKKIFLGLLWFLFGYYLTNLTLMIYIDNCNIKKLNNIKINLDKISKNNYFVFLTTCFIFYDEILDTENENISNEIKKICLGFTKYFFIYLTKNNVKNLTIDDIFSYYLIDDNMNGNINDINGNINDINGNTNIKQTKKLLGTFLKEYKINPNKYILKSILELFLTELKANKIQKNIKNNKEILKYSILKSQKSLNCIFTILVSDLNLDLDNNFYNNLIKENALINYLTYLFGLVSQLMDDFNDIDIDILENNNTIFTDGEYRELNIKKLLNLIYFIYEDISNKTKNLKKENLTNLNINLFIFNYIISKNLKNCKTDLSKYVPLYLDDLKDIRKSKNNFISNVNLNKFNLNSLINLRPKIYLISNYFNTITNEIHKKIFLLGIKNEIYFKSNFPNIIL